MNSLNNGLLTSILLNTGKGLNDMGNYDGCLANPNTLYFSTTVGIGGQAIPIFLGACLPRECLEEIPVLNQMLTAMIQEQTHSDKSFMKLSSPDHPNIGENNSMSYFGYVIIAIFAILSILGLLTQHTNLFG